MDERYWDDEVFYSGWLAAYASMHTYAAHDDADTAYDHSPHAGDELMRQRYTDGWVAAKIDARIC